MHEGVYRVLEVLHSGEPQSRSATIRAAGEAHTVIADLERRKPAWFEQTGPTLRLSEKGRTAYDWESRARKPALGEDALVQAFVEASVGRPAVKREWDQVLATPRSAARRALRLVRAGEAQRGVLFVGDDDLTSLALVLLLRAGSDEPRPVHALDIDPEIVSFLREKGVEAKVHDVREPLEAEKGRFGCVFTDPPYAPAGFELFVSRSTGALKPDGRLYVCFGQSRRSMERGLAKQRALARLGVLVEEVVPDFSEYDGAESIGSRSALWVCRRTPMSRPLELDPEAPLYTRRNTDPEPEAASEPAAPDTE